MITLNTLINILKHNRSNSKGNYLISSKHCKNTIIRKLKQFNEKDNLIYKGCLNRDITKTVWVVRINHNGNTQAERNKQMILEMIERNPDSFLAKLHKSKQEGSSNEFIKQTINKLKQNE